jgi:negative regulator of sigma E activity
MYMGDRWNGRGQATSQYVFLPITIASSGAMQLRWSAEWNLNVFTPVSISERNSFNADNFAVKNAMRQRGLYGYDLLGRMQNIHRTSAAAASKIVQVENINHESGLGSGLFIFTR